MQLPAPLPAPWPQWLDAQDQRPLRHISYTRGGQSGETDLLMMRVLGARSEQCEELRRGSCKAKQAANMCTSVWTFLSMCTRTHAQVHRCLALHTDMRA